MTIECTAYIDKRKMKQFHEILCSCGGSYKNNPIEFKNSWYVTYYINDSEFDIAWQRCNTNIVEKKSPFWKILLRRIGIKL